MESQFYNINILQLLLKWKFHIAVIMVAAVVLSTIFSSPYFITPKYKSVAVVYPSNIAPYSDENETEQMLQIIQSNDISDSIITKFNLPEHYKISRDYKYYNSTILWEYAQNVSISKTPYEGVSIEVMDKDPQIACDMVNTMIDLYNFKVRSLHEEKFGEVVQMYKRTLAKKKAHIDSLKSKLQEFSMNYGITDFGRQSEQVTKGFLKTIDGNGASRVNDKEVAKLKKNIEEKGAEYELIHNLIGHESAKYVDLKHEYELASMDYDRKFTYTNVITEPFVADKKSYPVRWIIVVVTALASFFISFIAIMVIENIKGMSGKSS
jgi:capsule polysaccharide export protein KpsE/RkpR